MELYTKRWGSTHGDWTLVRRTWQGGGVEETWHRQHRTWPYTKQWSSTQGDWTLVTLTWHQDGVVEETW